MQILFRNSKETEEEFITCKNIFPKTVEYRSQVNSNDTIFARFSCLPFYKELEEELKLRNSKLINSYEQHRYIADLENWYNDVKDFTFKTWFEWGNLKDSDFPVVVKGKTNSRKFQWKDCMFCENKEQLHNTLRLLSADFLLADQGLVVRKYEKLKQIAIGINDLPITYEWRTFWLGNKNIASGYYWSNFYDDFKDDCDLSFPKEGLDFAQKIANIVSKHTNFFVLDIGLKENGEFVLIEINDGQMSG